MNLFKQILKNRYLKLTLWVIIGQQVLVAAGTYIMGQLASQTAAGHFDIRWALALFVTASLSGSFVHYAVVWLSTKAIKITQYEYTSSYAKLNFNHPSHWRDTQTKSNRHDVMIRSGQDSIQSTIFFLTDLAATTTNILFNSFSIFLVTNSIMAASIFIAGASGILLIKVFGQKIAQATNNEIITESALNAHLAKSWDSIILGNSVFYQNWISKFELLFKNNQSAALKTTAQRDSWVALSAFTTTAIVLGTALGLAYYHQSNIALLAAIIVMLPRSLQIASHCQVVQSYFAQWESLKQKLVLTQATFASLAEIDLDQFIKNENLSISVQNDSAQPLTLSQDCIKIPDRIGRLTIRGNNGAGKSTLLLKLKKQLGDSSVYIPANHQLELNDLSVSASSGENVLSLWSFLNDKTTGPLLLDEWDAYLSIENKNKLNHEITQAAKNRLIIEVRHREDSLC